MQDSTFLGVSETHDGYLQIGWMHDQNMFYPSFDEESLAAQEIGGKCSEIWYLNFRGGTGGGLRWYMRSTGFKVRHFRGSGYPGDYDRYWHWDKIPSNYDPEKDYFPEFP